VRSIRRAAPGVQFLTSTHDPLCLRGLGAGEVVVMERDENHRVRALTDFPSPDAMRVDQLLTSEFFGLNSTLDPDVELRFDRYYELLGRPHRSAKDVKEMAAVKAELDAAKQMGGTLRERLMYEAIDKVVARSQRTRQPVVELKPEAVELVAKAWAEAPLSRS